MFIKPALASKKEARHALRSSLTTKEKHIIMKRMHEVMTPSPRQALDAAFAAADPSNSGVVSYETVQDVLGANDLELNDQVPRYSRDHA